MKRVILKKVISAAMAVVMAGSMFADFMAVSAYATDGETTAGSETVVTEPQPSAEPTTEPTPTPTPQPTPTPEPTATPELTSTATPEPTATPQPTPEYVAANNNIYIANYRVVDSLGNSLAKVTPGDKIILSVSVIDERIKADEFGVPAGQNTGRIHINLAQGAFSIPSSAVIDVKMRNPVTVTNTQGQTYQALSYTVTFRDVTYLGGTPAMAFGVSYTGQNGTNTDNNMPLPYPHTTLDLTVSQATDDVPAPTIILNNANYGKVAIIGEPFALVTTATNTSTNLELDNVSLKIVLPQGITLANGNSQVLIGNVAKGGTIDHTFSLLAEGVANDVTSLPVQLIYTFEAFVGGRRTQFTSQQDISINVQQPTRFEIQNMFNDMEMYMGNESYMSASLVNKGKTTVYNVTAELVSDTLTAYDVEFLGNIMPGSTASAEFDFTASQTGSSTGKLLVTYEDASGSQYTLEREFTIEVMEEMVWNEPVIDMPVTEPVVEKTSFVPYVIGGVAVLAAGGFFLWKKKQKAKRLAELEDEDEDI